MTDHSELKTLNFNTLIQDSKLQVRSKLDQPTVARYKAVYSSSIGATAMPPIEVAKVGDAYILVDGWHRVAALKALGIQEAEARITTTTQREAHWLAAKANLTHGLPLKSKELRSVFRAYVTSRHHRDREKGLKSYRNIANELGGLVQHTTLRNWMFQDFPEIAKQYGGDRPGPGSPLNYIEPSYITEIKEKLEFVHAASKTDIPPSDRAVIISLANQVLQSLMSSGPWEDDDEYDF